MTPRRPQVFVHVGEPKSGTTFVQQVMWGNRDQLAQQGVLLPGMHPQDHFRANQDLREAPQGSDDPTGSWFGEWDLLAEQALQAERAAVISHELLAAATDEQAARGRASLEGAEVHVVLSVRDFVSLLPAEWQETVKHRNRRSFEEWLARVRAAQSSEKAGPGRWFWRVHDTPDVLRRWAPGIPPERVHIITLPPPGSAPELLWERFASVIGIDPDRADLTTARPNASLGLAETEMLRRLNGTLSGDVGKFFYAVHVKEHLAHGYLAERPASRRPQLPEEYRDWAVARCQVVIDNLRESGYHIVGSLDELRPRAPGGGEAGGATDASNTASADDILDAAIGSLATVLHNQYDPPPPTPQESRLMDRQTANLAANPRFKRLVRDLSSRYPAVGRARVVTWKVMERARSRRR
jgi:hypothetical protein